MLNKYFNGYPSIANCSLVVRRLSRLADCKNVVNICNRVAEPSQVPAHGCLLEDENVPVTPRIRRASSPSRNAAKTTFHSPRRMIRSKRSTRICLDFLLAGRSILPSRGPCLAKVGYRAEQALGISAGRSWRPVPSWPRLKSPGLLVIETRVCFSLHIVCAIRLQARKDPNHIAVDRRMRKIEGDAGDGRRRVIAHAGQRTDRVVGQTGRRRSFGWPLSAGCARGCSSRSPDHAFSRSSSGRAGKASMVGKRSRNRLIVRESQPRRASAGA